MAFTFLNRKRNILLILVLMVVVDIVFLKLYTKKDTSQKNSRTLLDSLNANRRVGPSIRIEAKDQGVVFAHGHGPNGCDSLGARDVWVWQAGNLFYMNYDGSSAAGWITCLATSSDLVHWTTYGRQLQLGKPGESDNASASYGVTFNKGDKWYMYYLAASTVSDPFNKVPSFPYLVKLAVAKSPAGPWTKRAKFVALNTQPNTFFSASASPGQVVEANGSYLMFFSGSRSLTPYQHVIAKTKSGKLVDRYLPGKEPNKILRTIGIARTQNLEGEWKADTIPILPDSEQIENASMYYQTETKTWFLFTNHVGIYDKTEFTDAIWVYWSQDLEHWNPNDKAVVLDSTNVLWTNPIIGLPSVVKIGTKLAIFYDGFHGTGMLYGAEIHMRRDVGFATIDLPINVDMK